LAFFESCAGGSGSRRGLPFLRTIPSASSSRLLAASRTITSSRLIRASKSGFWSARASSSIRSLRTRCVNCALRRRSRFVAIVFCGSSAYCTVSERFICSPYRSHTERAREQFCSEVFFGQPEAALITKAASRPNIQQLEIRATMRTRMDVVKLQPKSEGAAIGNLHALFPRPMTEVAGVVIAIEDDCPPQAGPKCAVRRASTSRFH